MNAAAASVYSTLRREGTQASVVGSMQTRTELYDVLGYRADAPIPP
jgi:methylisocitrate lyase